MRLNETAFVFMHDGELSLEVQRRFWQLAVRVRAHACVREAVIGMNNLTLFLTSPDEDVAEIERWLMQLWNASEPGEVRDSRVVEIPVTYGGEAGPDLAFVAHACGMSEEAVVRAHTAAEYVVYFLGFQPGFAYLGGLDPRLAVARRAEPRMRVPAGSVGIGGEQTGVYPRSGPGGWQLIGRTDIPLFDWRASSPALLRAGDRVRFVARVNE